MNNKKYNIYANKIYKLQQPEDFFHNVKEKIFSNNGYIAVLAVYIIGLITHFYMYAHDTVCPDSLSAGIIHVSSTGEATLGRWGLTILDNLRGGLVNSLLIIVVSLAFLSLTTIVVMKMFKIKNKILVILLAGLIATAPQFSETFMFIYCADWYCLAMLTAVLTVYFLNKKVNIKNSIIAILLTIMTLSIYQAYSGVIVGLAIIVCIFKLLQGAENKKIIKEGFQYMLVIAIGMLLYFILTNVLLKVQGLGLSSYNGANKLGIMNTISNLFTSIKRTYEETYQFLFTNNIIWNSFWKRKYINVFMFLIGVFDFVYIIIKNKIYKDKIKLLLLCLLIGVLPIGLNFINIVATDSYINLVMASSLILIYIMVLNLYNIMENYNISIIKYITVILITILIGTYILADNASYMARKEAI